MHHSNPLEPVIPILNLETSFGNNKKQNFNLETSFFTFSHQPNNRISKLILFPSYVSRFAILKFVTPYNNKKSKNSILLSDERKEFEVSWRCTAEGVSNIQASSILNDVPMMTSSWIFKFPDSRWLSTVILETIDFGIAKQVEQWIVNLET